MIVLNKCCVLLSFLTVFGSTSLALPTVHFQKTLSVGGGSSSDVAVNFGGLEASAGSAGVSASAGSGASASAFASASAAATAGGVGGAAVEKEITYGHKTIPQRTEIVAEKTFTEAPKVISEQTIQGQAQVQRTVIEKTVIPQYVEKTIQVPSYVEKTIRVPTVVEHKVRVPVTPKVVEKTYEENAHAAGASAHAHAAASIGGAGKVQLQERPVYAHKQFHKHGLFGHFHSGIRTNAAAAGSSSAAGAYAGSTGSSAANGVQVNAFKSGGGGLLGNILNIPVATLGAVGNLFNSFGNAGASVSFNKSYRTV